MTGALHIRRALEIMRKSDAPQESFRASALFLRQFNDELTDWEDMYFSRDPEASRPAVAASRRSEEREKSKNLVEVKGTWSLDESPVFATAIPTSFQNAVAMLSFANIGSIQAALSTPWFMIGPAQPRFSTTAAIRRGALEPLVEVPRDKTKVVLTQFARIAPAATLSRMIRAISIGGFVDLDWFSRPDAQHSQTGVQQPLGDSGLSFANWYRCIRLRDQSGRNYWSTERVFDFIDRLPTGYGNLVVSSRFSRQTSRRIAMAAVLRALR